MTTKILHILSGDLWGGAEAQMGLQIRAQRELGLDSRALLFNDGETSKRYTEFGIPLEVVRENLGIFKFFSATVKSSRKFQPQIIVSHGYKETFVAGCIRLINKTPFVSTIHGGTESYRGIKAFKSFFYTNFSLLLSKVFAKTIIVPTQDLQRQLAVRGEIIGNVADVSAQTNNLGELKKSIGFDALEPLIIWVGRIVPVKRIDRAIAAVAVLKKEGININLAIVGDGELKSSSQEFVKLLGLEDRVKFLGFRNDAEALIACATILLLTSESEGLPTVMAEAMTKGVKLVMSDLAGIREIGEKFVNYPLKLVFPPTPKAFAEAIKESLLENTVIPPELLAQTQKWFDPNRAAREALDIYRQLL